MSEITGHSARHVQFQRKSTEFFYKNCTILVANLESSSAQALRLSYSSGCPVVSRPESLHLSIIVSDIEHFPTC